MSCIRPPLPPYVSEPPNSSADAAWKLRGMSIGQEGSVVSALNARISDLEELVESVVRVVKIQSEDMLVVNARLTELEQYIAELENS